ncbi:hypothetical protein OPV22_011308 [Ensete ventricosum]|uniref:RING-type E3 ubiquitin transferase n=1 Tax=Ensete ventricosum TaxID=4639 RepID=A0AAV8RMR8_ENSVE|nr:hypothetical protein OPV22_011308 [Ensete ventricosum]
MPRPSDRRRFLTLPVVQPGANVRPIVLLDALVVLADEIVALRACPFPVHRRSAREAIREVVAVREFLADVRGRGSALPDSIVVSFSELYITLHKLCRLLQDCARPGARLWVLMRSERVSKEFLVLVRSISAALDVLPLASIDAVSEVKELIRLVEEQAWKAAIETEPDDAQAMRSVSSVLCQFKNGIAPNRSALRQILDHLHIRSWNDCGEEIAFLEELFFESSDDDEELALLDSLMVFMVYCRAVLFDTMDDEKIADEQLKAQATAMNHVIVNLDYLRCPISLELMTDPVTIATGQTYDRASISKWFESDCPTCPVTGEKVANKDLVPNSAIRNLVEQFCQQNNVRFPEPNAKQKRDVARTEKPLTSAAAGAMAMAAASLVDKLATGTNQEKNKAAYEIRKLSKSNIFNRACLVEAGLVPWLLHLFSSMDTSIQDNAVAAVLNLSKHPDGSRAIVEVGGLCLIVDVIRYALKTQTRQNAVAILFYLSSVEEYRLEIGKIPQAIPTLVEHLREGTHRGRKNAIVALYMLLQAPDNLPKALDAGAVPVLVALLSSEQEGLAGDAVGVLAKTAERHDGATAILESSAIPHLVEFLRSSTSRSGREKCVSTLLSLCDNGGAKLVRLLGQMPALMPSLYSLVAHGTSQARMKAISLVNCIHSLNGQGYPAIVASAEQEHIIRAQ